MEAAFTKFRTVIAILATLAVGAAMTHTIVALGRARANAGKHLPA